jgi:Holliday junction resolvase-like predicted endonuclease
MSTTDAGRQAEEAAAVYLEKKGCKVIARNWRTRMCEIDIIASRKDVVYFCEIKYRQSNKQGAGLDYITPKKLGQMRFAAGSWVHIHGYSGAYELVAIEVSGSDFRITGVVKDF